MRPPLVSKDRNEKKEEGKHFVQGCRARNEKEKQIYKTAARMRNFELVKFYLKRRVYN